MAYKALFMKSYRTLIRQNTSRFNDSFLSASCYFTNRYQRFRNFPSVNYLQYIPSANIWTNVKNCKEYETESNELSDLVESVEDPNQPLVKLTVVGRTGKKKVIEARVGMTVMKAITKHEDLEMEASCGGELACTTCHVYCKEKQDYFTPISEMEQDLLDEVSCYRVDSRLSCQMKILKEFDNVQIQISSDGTNYFEEGSRKSR